MCIFITHVLDEAESCQIAFRQLGVTVGNRSMYGSESRKAQISWEPAMQPRLETLRTSVPSPFFLVNLEQSSELVDFASSPCRQRRLDKGRCKTFMNL